MSDERHARELAEQVAERNDQIADLMCRLESQRMQRHHDVLCLVLKEFMRYHVDRGFGPEPSSMMVDHARKLADLAYPPPKAEP